MKEKIILIGGIIAFAIILILASETTKNPEINNQGSDSKINNTEIFDSNESNNTEIINNEQSKIVYANENTFEAEVLNSDEVVLVDFYADWCTPCKMLAPTLEKIARENDDIKVVKVNVDEAPNLAMEYGATSIPLLVAIKNGQEKDRLIGVVPESEILRILRAQ